MLYCNRLLSVNLGGGEEGFADLVLTAKVTVDILSDMLGDEIGLYGPLSDGDETDMISFNLRKTLENIWKS